VMFWWWNKIIINMYVVKSTKSSFVNHTWVATRRLTNAAFHIWSFRPVTMCFSLQLLCLKTHRKCMNLPVVWCWGLSRNVGNSVKLHHVTFHRSLHIHIHFTYQYEYFYRILHNFSWRLWVCGTTLPPNRTSPDRTDRIVTSRRLLRGKDHSSNTGWPAS
jgi:hypothetical protein